MQLRYSRHPLRPALAATALAVSVSFAVASCGGSGTDARTGATASSGTAASTTAPASSTTSAPPADTQHNDADVVFASGMIPHHRQAIAMAEMAQARARSGPVRTLAGRIKAAQAPEITQMSEWLKAWGQPVPTGSHMGSGMGSASPSMGHSGHSSSGRMSGTLGGMAGMMSEGDMRRMGQMSGIAFDRAFLTGMVAHHHGAVAMAQTELREGSNAQAKELAQSIIDSQNAEIDQMTELLRQLR